MPRSCMVVVRQNLWSGSHDNQAVQSFQKYCRSNLPPVKLLGFSRLLSVVPFPRGIGYVNP